MANSNLPQLDAARRAKQILKEKYQHHDWFRGAGIVPLSEGFGVRLNVASTAKGSVEELPVQCEGVPVEIVFLEGYAPRDF